MLSIFRKLSTVRPRGRICLSGRRYLTDPAGNSSVGAKKPKSSTSTQATEAATGGHKPTAVESIIDTTSEWNRAYVNMEASIMHRIHTSNKNRFRVILLTTVVGIIWVVAVFGEKLRKMLTTQTADLAKETLENKSLQIQTQELATAVVQTVLNDKEVTLRAAAFLRDAINIPDTKEALMSLLSHVLQHQDTKQALTDLTKAIIADVTSDQV